MFITKKKLSNLLFNFGVGIYNTCGKNLSFREKTRLRTVVLGIVYKRGKK